MFRSIRGYLRRRSPTPCEGEELRCPGLAAPGAMGLLHEVSPMGSPDEPAFAAKAPQLSVRGVGVEKIKVVFAGGVFRPAEPSIHPAVNLPA